MTLAAIESPPLALGPLEWAVVTITVVIIFVIHGPKLLQDIRKWLGLDKGEERR